VIEAETCCRLVTLNKINIHNTSCNFNISGFHIPSPYLDTICVLTCESLLLTFIIIIIIITVIELSLGGNSSYTSTDKTNKNKYT
jgi:hypothetical protein